MATAKNNKTKKARMDELFERANQRLGRYWLNGWLCYFFGVITENQIITHAVLDNLERALSHFIMTQATNEKTQSL